MTETVKPESDLKPGVVTVVYPNQCNVSIDGGPTLLCSYRRSKVINNETEWRERSPVAPGDKVGVKVLGSKDGVIEIIYRRENCIQRRAPGREGKVLHTIAANVDAVVIVSAYKEPDFSPGFIDRFLIAAQRAEIKPIVVINKMDLRTDPDHKPWRLYEEFGILCFPVTVKDVSTIEPLREFLKAKTSVFCGHSGVGKTSLLHELYGVSVGKVGEISKATGKGKHTTTVSNLVETPDGTRFIDTPGIKEFGIFGVDPKQLIEYYPELWDLQQKHEPYEHLERYDIYKKIKAALEDEGR
jgi:ribosome biogenesis GTPase